MDGNIVPSDTLYPIAMSPALSTARLDMNRFFESGAHVDCCVGEVGTAPPVMFSWYQRGCATFGEPPFPTVWVSHRDSLPPRFVYWFCIIRRYDSVSTLLPLFSGTFPGPTLNVAIGTFVGPVSVELDGVA